MQRQIDQLSREIERLKRVEKQASYYGGVDMSVRPNVFTLANNDVASLFGGSPFTGLIIVTNDSSGAMAMFMVGYFQTHEIIDPSAAFSPTAGTPGISNVYKSGLGTTCRIENKTGGTMQYTFSVIKHRAG
jgi:hypothetical protein